MVVLLLSVVSINSLCVQNILNFNFLYPTLHTNLKLEWKLFLIIVYFSICSWSLDDVWMHKDDVSNQPFTVQSVHKGFTHVQIIGRSYKRVQYIHIYIYTVNIYIFFLQCFKKFFFCQPIFIIEQRLEEIFVKDR